MADKCRSCGKFIIWAKSRTGKRMPVDADPVPDGNVILDRDGPEILAFVLSADQLANVAEDEPRHKSHHATCPNAARKPKG